MLDRFRNRYILDDETASILWESVGMFVRPENRDGDQSITSVIMKTIIDESAIGRSIGMETDSTFAFEAFLSELERVFNEQRGIDLYEAREFVGAYMVWNDLIENEYFDPRHPLMVDKPYYRSLVTTGICGCILACIHGINSGKAWGTYDGDGDASDLSIWVERVLMLCERIVEIEPLKGTDVGYFRRYSEGVTAQNHNVWVCLKSLSEWFKGWSPRALRTFTERSETQIELIVRLMAEREAVFRESDRG